MAVTWVINPFTGALDAVGFPGAAPFVTSVAGGVGITNSPEPIVGAGTVNLDIDSLTTESSLASGDLFAFVDVSAGGTAINNQRKATLANLTTFLGSSFQPLDAGLTALASLGAGIAVSDGADGWFARSIAVTDTATVDLTITNANGVAGNPTIQADVIVAGLNPLLDHGLLLGLTDDDHAQYTLRAGRTGTTNDTTLTTSVGGTGTLAGGTDVGAVLKLVASTSGSAHTGFVRIDDAQDWWPNVPDTLGTPGFTVVKFDPSIVDTAPSSVKTLILFNPTVTAATASQIDGEWNVLHIDGDIDTAGNPNLDEFYALRCTTTFTSAGVDVPGPWIRRLFADQTVTRVTAGTIGVTDSVQTHFGLLFTPSFIADGASAFLGLLALNGTRFQPSFSGLNGGQIWADSDATIPLSVSAHSVLNPIVTTSGGGTVNFGTMTALNILDLTRATENLSVVSQGALVQMRHAGPGVFGANAAPTNASVGLEVQSTTRCFLNASMTTAQQVTMTGVAVANGMQLYDSTLNRMQFRENGAWVGYVNGTGASGRVAYWTGAASLDDDADFLWDSTTNVLTVGVSPSSTNGIVLVGSALAASSFYTTRIDTASETNSINNYGARQHVGAGVSNISLLMARSRGTEGTQTVVVDGDVLGRLEARGYDGSVDYLQAAQLDFVAGVGAQSTTSMPGAVVLSTTPDGTIVPVERWRWLATGETNVCVTALSIAATHNILNVLPNGTTVTASLSPALRILLFNGTLTFAAAATTIGQLFQAAPTITTSGASRALGPLIGLGVNATWTPASTHTITGTASRAVNHSPTFTDNGTAGNTATDAYGLRNAGNLNTNWTVTDWAAVKMLDPGGSGGALTRLGAVEVDALTRGTSNYSLWSKGSDVIVSHAGGAAFATGTATFTALTNASVGLEVQGTTKAFRYSQLTDAQRTTLTGVAVNDGMALYDTTRNTVSMRMHSNWLDVPGWYHIIVKSADQTVTNTTTLTDDTELQFSVGADEVWHVELRLGMSGNNAASDAKWGFTAAAASFVVAQSNWNAVHYTAAAALTQVNATAFASTTEAVTGGTAAVDAGTSTTIWPVFAVYRFRTSAATTVKVQFALLAGAAVGRNAVMEAGSTLFARRIS